MRRRILKALVREGALTEQQVEDALALETETGQSFDHIIRDKGWVSEEKLLTVIHRKTLWPFERSLASYEVPKDFVEAVVAKVTTGDIPRELVDSTLLWVRSNRADSPYPFFYFERVLRIRGQRAGIAIPAYSGGIPSGTNR